MKFGSLSSRDGIALLTLLDAPSDGLYLAVLQRAREEGVYGGDFVEELARHELLSSRGQRPSVAELLRRNCDEWQARPCMQSLLESAAFHQTICDSDSGGLGQVGGASEQVLRSSYLSPIEDHSLFTDPSKFSQYIQQVFNESFSKREYLPFREVVTGIRERVPVQQRVAHLEALGILPDFGVDVADAAAAVAGARTEWRDTVSVDHWRT